MYMEEITIKYTRNNKKLTGLVTTPIPVPIQDSSVATGIVTLT